MESASTCSSLSPSLILLFVCILIFYSENASGSFHHGHVPRSSPSTQRTITISTLFSRGDEPRHPRESYGNRLHAKSKGSSDIKNEEVVTLIHSHHLLDHKPDNMILSGKKFKLRGVACLGRPGVALCIGSRNNVKKFMGKLKGSMPQKKFASDEIEANDNNNEGGAAASSSSDSAAVAILDQAVDGFEEVSISELRELLTAVGQEDRFFALLGIDNNSPGQTQKADGTGNHNGRSDGTVKKKRKKRG
mmetsp:Transcript_19657/g.42717  ORF Transcript_19657/g.42717 Transcript_19657/m.42717 type:complete len:248 (-) Transcript_19657:1940-2683(-)